MAITNTLGPDQDNAVFQGSQGLQMNKGVEGMCAQTGKDNENRSIYNATNPGVALPWGRVIVLNPAGTLDNGAEPAMLPNATGQTVLGILGLDKTWEKKLDTDVRFSSITATGFWGLPSTQQGRADTRGRLLIYSEVAVGFGDPVFFRHTANGALVELGRFRNDNDGGNADQLAGAKFIETITAPGLVTIEIDL